MVGILSRCHLGQFLDPREGQDCDVACDRLIVIKIDRLFVKQSHQNKVIPR